MMEVMVDAATTSMQWRLMAGTVVVGLLVRLWLMRAIHPPICSLYP